MAGAAVYQPTWRSRLLRLNHARHWPLKCVPHNPPLLVPAQREQKQNGCRKLSASNVACGLQRYRRKKPSVRTVLNKRKYATCYPSRHTGHLQRGGGIPCLPVHVCVIDALCSICSLCPFNFSDVSV